MCDGSIETIRPGDFNTILSKIANVYELELQERLTTVQDFEKMIGEGTPGISKEMYEYERNGKTYTVPVYTLKGIEFAGLVTTINESLSGHNPNGTYGERWFEYEHGTSHISCSLATDLLRGTIEYSNGYNGGAITYLMPRQTDIISMGATDIFSPGEARKANVYSDRNTRFQFTEEVEGNTSYDFNEYVVERYSLNEEGHSTKIVPEALFKYGDRITDEMLAVVSEMEDYIRSHGIRGEDFVMPIILIDQSQYSAHHIESEYERKREAARTMRDIAQTVDNAEKYIDEIVQDYREDSDNTTTEERGQEDTQPSVGNTEERDSDSNIENL